MKNKKMIPVEPEVLDAIASRVSEYLCRHIEISAQQWITEKEALALLGIGKVSLYKLRAEGKIRYSKILSKNIMYDRSSILELLNQNAREPF